jgi:ATP-dependent Lon protease
MYKIETNGYNIEDKLIIAKKYLIPKILKELNTDININLLDENIKYIINNFTNNEKGVRNLKRCLETIYKKLNLLKFVNDDKNIKDVYFKNIELTSDITNDKINILLNSFKMKNDIPFGMYN